MIRNRLGWGTLIAFLGALGTAMISKNCADHCDRPSLRRAKDKDGEYIPQVVTDGKDRPITTSINIYEHDSYIKVSCFAQRTAEPNDPEEPEMPSALEAEVCAGKKCATTYGSYAELEFRHKDWDLFPEIDFIYCIVSIPEYCTFTGPPWAREIDECYPEKMVYVSALPVEDYCRVKESSEPKYCANGYWDNEESEWHCTEWY